MKCLSNIHIYMITEACKDNRVVGRMTVSTISHPSPQKLWVGSLMAHTTKLRVWRWETILTQNRSLQVNALVQPPPGPWILWCELSIWRKARRRGDNEDQAVGSWNILNPTAEENSKGPRASTLSGPGALHLQKCPSLTCLRMWFLPGTLWVHLGQERGRGRDKLKVQQPDTECAELSQGGTFLHTLKLMFPRNFNNMKLLVIQGEAQKVTKWAYSMLKAVDFSSEIKDALFFLL